MKLLIPGTSKPMTIIIAKTIGLQARHPDVDVDDINWWAPSFVRKFVDNYHSRMSTNAWGSEQRIPVAVLYDADDIFCDAAVREVLPDIGVSEDLLMVLAMTGMHRLDAEALFGADHCEVSLLSGVKVQVRTDDEGVGFSTDGKTWSVAKDQASISTVWDRFITRAVDQSALHYPLRQYAGPDTMEFRIDEQTGNGLFSWMERGVTIANYVVTPSGGIQHLDLAVGIPPFAQEPTPRGGRSVFEKLLIETYERALYNPSARHLRRHLYQGDIVEHYQLRQGLQDVGGYRFPCRADGNKVLVTVKSQTYTATATIGADGSVSHRQHIDGEVLDELDMSRLFQKQLHKFVLTNKPRLVELANAIKRGI